MALSLISVHGRRVALQTRDIWHCRKAGFGKQCVRGLEPAYLADAIQPVARIPGRQRTTPAVIVDVGIGLSVYATVHSRRPSVSRRRGTNMEQFASRSDAIKFPANLQSQTKISLILGVSIVSKLFSVCEVSEVLQHFFTLNLM